MIKLFEENTGMTLRDVGLGNGLLDMMLKARATRENTGIVDSIQMRHVVSQKMLLRQRGDDPGGGRNACRSGAKGLMVRTLRTR